MLQKISADGANFLYSMAIKYSSDVALLVATLKPHCPPIKLK